MPCKSGTPSQGTPDKDCMGRRLFPMICVGVAAAALACAADPVSVGTWKLAAERCAGEISTMHGVWRSREVFLPAYGDLDLVVYLASLGSRHPGVAVVPMYSPEPICFRSNHVVFLSTGFILKAGSERELTDAIRSARVEVQSPILPACAAMAIWVPTSFADVRRRLAKRVAEYEDLTARRLRKRAEDVRAPDRAR